MPRTKRVLIEKACYHIINRGNQKQDIFLEPYDYEKYLEIFKHYKNKFKFKVYAYCLMPNHIHVIIDVKKTADLAKIMQGITQTYTVWFNKKYDKVGRLWQGRFKSRIIQKDEYLFDCLKYVELNPLRAKITSFPIEYSWSSWKERALTEGNSSLLDSPDIL